MLEVRKSRSCGISAIFIHYCFMIETQALLTASNFFSLLISSWKGASLFNGGLVFQLDGASFLSGGGGLWGSLVLMRGECFEKIVRWGTGKLWTQFFHFYFGLFLHLRYALQRSLLCNK